MFYVKSFSQNLVLHPRNICQNVQNLMQEYLYKNVEGTCTPFGYLISVLKIENVDDGKILLSGHVSFKIEYQAIVLKPEIGEIVDCNVASITKMGYFGNVGPLTIFIHNAHVPNHLISKIEINKMIRLRIIGTKIDSSSIYAIGSLSEEYIGMLDLAAI